MEQGVRNALAITELLGHPEVKVYRGLDHSSTTDSFQVLEISSFIHGQNGIGEAVIADSTRDVEDTPAVDFIIDAAKTYGKDLVYVRRGGYPGGGLHHRCGEDLRQGPRVRADRPADEP